ncbi:mitochondrial inner membrane protein Mitofilin [Auriculariales sp. MPI-PUGE-AT-0066]|nr:mitochondrial inner membrane protein Mitofilin [Auriculariales sp. MPI-PUGE-AT-0066]
MHRAAVSRTALQAARNAGARRTFADVASETVTAPPVPKKRVLPRLLVATGLGTAAFYGGSTALALNSEPYRDFFLDVPGGAQILAECDKLGWDNIGLSKTGKSVVDKARQEGAVAAAQSTQARLQQQLAQSKAAAQARMAEAKQKTKDVTDAVVTKIEKSTPGPVKDAVKKVTAAVQKPAEKATHADSVSALIQAVEDALKGVGEAGHTAAAKIVGAAETQVEAATGPIYTKPLPIGFEPPPGYSVPKKGAPKSSPSPSTPIAPGQSSVSVPSSDAHIARLVASVEALARAAKDDSSVSASVKDALTSARASLTSLAARIDGIPGKIQTELATREKEHTRAVLELEMAAQTRFDEQEDMWRSAFETERRKILDAYREKLHVELDANRALIEERLKQEVIAQGIELQRRWIREIKVRVEQERNGRLAKLDELSADLRRLEGHTVDNASYLSENLRLHRVQSAVRALTAVLEQPIRQPFRKELAALATAAGDDADNGIIGVALQGLSGSDIPDFGVDPLADLATWFSAGVVPDVRRVALVPARGGVIAHAAGAVLGSATFERKGEVEGEDAFSVLARATHALEREDLDGACRELNQLQGSPRLVASEWLEAARRRLQLQQALDVVQAAATLDALAVA